MRASAMIDAMGLSKTFTVHKKAPGLWASVQGLFRRERIAKHAVRDATFRIEPGEIVGLVGANGAGKTTLVKMLAGVIHPTSGMARVLGFEPWRRDNRFRRQIALIMGQKAALWWDLPAADCFLLLREIYRIPEAEYRSTIEELTAVLGIRDQLQIQIRRLSLGERMKMELIAALLHAPRVVFLDEPTIGLDLSAQRAIRDFLLEYRRKHRPAMLLTSHYMEDIERLCERIIILREGAIVYDGPLADVVESYATHKVITAHLRPDSDPLPPRPDGGAWGDVLEWSSAQLRLRVPRDGVARTAAEILARHPVADLAIEEPEIGSVIERIMMQRDEGGP